MICWMLILVLERGRVKFEIPRKYAIDTITYSVYTYSVNMLANKHKSQEA